jgi:hypothetical protein
MTTPIISELALQLEPTAADSFLDGGTEPAPALRELDRRRGDGIEVRLLWNEATGSVTVAVSDARTGDAFAFEVDGADALDAFHHPYAHAAARGIPTSA